MNLTILIMTGVLAVTLFSPFGVFYAIKAAKRKDLRSHRKIQNTTYLVCILAVLLLEGLIRFSGGSGSLASQSTYYGTTFFTVTLISHILVAILTYLAWTILILFSNLKFRKTLPGTFSSIHKKLGITIFSGLIYTAITALLVYLMTLNLI